MVERDTQWLAELRKQKGFTQEQLAQQMGVKRQFISMIENGLAKPSVAKAKIMGQLLGFEWTRIFEE